MWSFLKRYTPMNKQWKLVKSITLLAVLPLVVTAAASAHQWMSNSSPISIDIAGEAAAVSNQIGSARVHTVALNRAGVVEGRIASINAESKESSGLAELRIYFVQNGEIVEETTTLEDGTFSVDGLSEGAYSFVATGENGFAAYGVRVTAGGEEVSTNVMEAAAVSPQLEVVKSILKDRLPSEVANEILEDAAKANHENVVGANRVHLNNGSLTGHVLPIIGDVAIVAGTQVHIFRDDEQVAEVIADQTGSFMVPDMEPGVYSFVAAGPSGFAAVSFEAVAQPEAAAIDNEATVTEFIIDSQISETPVTTVAPVQDADYSDSMDVYLTSGQDSGVIHDNMDYGSSDGGLLNAPIEYAGESVGSGSAVGGSCGSCGDFGGVSSCGGGGGGGGGGAVGGGMNLRRLLLIGAAVAIPLALSGDTDDIVVIPISPANP
jgi:hypothetical protein